jgi:hypothetical protein
MSVHFRRNFAHRLNSDRSYDSVCRACFSTIGSAMEESALVYFECIHLCDPIRLHQVKQIQRPSRSRAQFELPTVPEDRVDSSTA